MEVKLINNNLVLDVIVDNPSGDDHDQYAFYLMSRKVKLNEMWYSSNTHVQFTLPDETGEYYVTCFQRNLKKNTKSKSNSNTIRLAPVIRWKTPTDSATGQYKQILYFRRIIFGDYDTQKKIGYIPRVGASPIPLLAPINYGSRNDRNIEFALNSWKFLPPIWKMYFETRKYKYLKEIYTFMLDWYQSLPRDNTRSFAWYDMAVGTRAIHIALFKYVLAEENIDLSQQNKKVLEQIVAAHIAYLKDEKNLKFNNHGVWQILGLRLLYWAHEEVDEKNIDFCEQQLAKLIELNFTEEDVSSENSPFYHKYTADLICQVPTSLFAKTQSRIKSIQNKKDEISAWLTSPNGYFFLIGDSDGKGMSLPSNVAGDLEQSDASFISKFYRESGYAIVRSRPETPPENSAALIFHGTSASYSHAHSDKLSFILIHKGIELITDSGKFSYENDAWRKYFVSDWAHNTVGFSKKIFMPVDTSLGDAKISECRLENGVYSLSGSTKKKTVEFLHERSISYKPDEYLSLNDKVRHGCQSEGELEVRLHFGIGISLQEVNSRIVALHENKIIASIEPDSKMKSYEIYYGSETPILGWSSRIYRKKKPINTLVFRFGMDVTEVDTKILLEPSRFFSKEE